MSEPKTMEFRTELEQLLDIIVHSLYSEREIFLRELISNASDAIDKLRFESIAEASLAGDDTDWRIELRADTEARTLSIIDNGIGMSASNIVEQLGTIARSGTKEFLKALRESDSAQRPELIGQFGVGFYSSFMVADEVTVLTRQAGHDQGVRWQSRGKGEFTVEDIERPERGTEVILHLRDDADEFLEEFRLRTIVRKYSDFIEHPVQMETTRTEGEGDDAKTVTEMETLNSRQALWLRPADEVSDAEHEEFYHKISHDFRAPARHIHFAAEGTLEYRALLYLPAERPMDFMWTEPKAGLQLYIQRVFIMDRCEDLMPLYLRFVKGVVDSSDLPLNVSREMLQDNRVVSQIRKGLVNRVLRELEEMKKDEREGYEEFFASFGPTLKEGVSQDHENRERIAKLLLFRSTRTAEGETIDLDGYLERMPEGQETIWFLSGEREDLLSASPALETLKEKGEEVLLLTDPVDEFLVAALGEFEGKKLKAADRGELEEEDSKDEAEEDVGEFAGLFDFFKTSIAGLSGVRLSKRLRSSAAVLVAGEHGVSAQLERIMKQMGRGDELPPRERVLELNADHAAVKALQKLHAENPADRRVEDIAHLLYDQAVIAEGSTVEDPAAMAARMNRLIEDAGN
jgi:molecular chaperone HtpG